jgi:hypothetical protein
VAHSFVRPVLIALRLPIGYETTKGTVDRERTHAADSARGSKASWPAIRTSLGCSADQRSIGSSLRDVTVRWLVLSSNVLIRSNEEKLRAKSRSNLMTLGNKMHRQPALYS